MPRLLEKMASNDIPSIQSTNLSSSTCATQLPILGQPQHLNPLPQDHLDPTSSNYYEITGWDNNSTEFAQSSSRTFTTTSSTSVPFASFVHGAHNGYNLDGLDLASTSMSAIDYSSPSDCVEEGSNWVDDGLWRMDELTSIL